MLFSIDTDEYICVSEDPGRGHTFEVCNGIDRGIVDISHDQLIDLFYMLGDYLFPNNDIVLE